MHRNFHVPAGTSARIAVDLRVEDLGAADYTLSGAVYDEQHRSVPMAVQEAGESEDGLPAVVVPQMPVGLWQYELRAGGRPLLHGHLHVLPSPLCGEEGRCNWVVSADPAAEVARISVDWQPEPIDYGRVGELADAAVMERLYDDRPTPVAEKEWSDSVLGFEYVNMAVQLDGRAYAAGIHATLPNLYADLADTPLYVQLERPNAGLQTIVSQQAVLLGDASACPEGVTLRKGWTYWTLPGDARLRAGETYVLRVFYYNPQGDKVYMHFKLNRAQGESVAAEVYALCSAPVYPAANTLLEEACARAEADAAAALAAAERAEEALGLCEAGSTGLAAAIYEEVQAESATPAGTANATCQYIELDAQHVPQGRLQSISLRSRNGGNPAVGSYMAVWELGADGVSWSYLGSSTNNPAQTMNTIKTWEFADGIVLSGRKLRILAQPDPTGEWEPGPQLGVRTSTPQAGDATKVYNNGTAYAFLPELSIAVQQQVARFAPAAHVDDAVAHISADERSSWDSTATNLTGHTGNTTIHITANERAKWNNITNTSITEKQRAYLAELSSCTALNGKTGYLLVDYDLTEHTDNTTVHFSAEEHKWLNAVRSGSQELVVPVLKVNGTQGKPLMVLRGNVTNVTVTGSQLSFNVPRLTMMSDCPALYSSSSDTGETHVWFAVAPDAVSLAPLGLTEPGVYAGDSSLPLFLRGSELRWNGAALDVAALEQLAARKDELLALLNAGQAQVDGSGESG